MYVHCSTVYNSKDLKPTQMPIDSRLNKENVAQIHHGIPCNRKKWWVHVLYREMDESGSHHSLQTDTRTENRTLYVLTYRQVLNNENTWTQGYTGVCWGGIAEGQQVVGRLQRDNRGRNARYRWWGDVGSKSHCHVCTYATILHVLHMYLRN